METQMNVVFICDKNYIIPTKTAINSLIQNCKKDDIIGICVIGSGLDYKDIQVFTSMELSNISIKVIIPDNLFSNINTEHPHVSKAALYKFFLPELLPVLDKVLYIDGDMLILKSISKLYNMDLKDYYAAVVKDMRAEKELKQHLKKGVENYFNSGMMLLNLKKLREENISQILLQKKIEDKSTTFMDQDVLNVVFDGHIITVSPEYNYMCTYKKYSVKEIADYYNMSEENMQLIVDEPTILHLTDKYKPWNSILEEHKLWYTYLNKDDYYIVMRNINDALLKRCEESAEYILREKINKQFILRQHKADKEFLDGGKTFNIDISALKGVTQKIFEMKEEIFYELDKYSAINGIVIYGAGNVGQALFKLLWFLGYEKHIKGFAVEDIDNNIDELYGKPIRLLKEYSSDNIVFVAIKNISDTLMDSIELYGFRKTIMIKV